MAYEFRKFKGSEDEMGWDRGWGGGRAVSHESSRTPTQPYTAAVACFPTYNNNEGAQ